MITKEDIDAIAEAVVEDRRWMRYQSVLQMVEEYRVTAGQEKDPKMSSKLVTEEFSEWWRSFEDDPKEELKELADLVYVIYGYANAVGWNLDEAVCRVHENNMGRMYQPDGSIKRREDGKVEKNKDYPKVDLGDLV